MQDLSKGALQAGLAVEISRKLEGALESIGATGKGLHEKVTSVEKQLPEALVVKLRFIASVRNKVVHEAELLPELDIAALAEAGTQAMDALKSLNTERKPATRRSPAKAQKKSKRPAAPAPGICLAQPLEAMRLGGVLLLLGLALVVLLVLLGNDGVSLWIGAFAIFFTLGGYLQWRLRRAAAPTAR